MPLPIIYITFIDIINTNMHENIIIMNNIVNVNIGIPTSVEINIVLNSVSSLQFHGQLPLKV